MTQPISRETAIALAKEVGAVFDVLALGRHDYVQLTEFELERLCNLAVAHSRKDAEPAGWFKLESIGFNGTNPVWNQLMKGHGTPLFTQPPEADKLLQQALEALNRFIGYLWASSANGSHPDIISDLKLHKKTISNIGTYLEGKK